MAKSLTHPKYRADIDGLRGVAILLVLGFHAFPDAMKGGFIGVDIFFVISGYLISTIIFSNLASNNFNFGTFYSRRIKRIFPALVAVLCGCYLLGWCTLFSEEFKQLGKHMAAGAVFASNFVLWKESGYFDTDANSKILLHLWSLGIEEQFYLFFPLLIWLAFKYRINFLFVLIPIVLVSFILNIVQIRTDPVAAFYSPGTRMWELILGALLSYGETNKKDINLISVRHSHPNFGLAGSRWSEITSVLGFVFIAIAMGMLTSNSPFPGWWALLPTLGAVLIIAAGPMAFLNRAVLSNKLLVWFGLISYPLYLWHYPLLTFTRIIDGMYSRRTKLVVVIVSIVFAWLTYRFIEKPVRFGPNSGLKVTILCLLMAAWGAVGLVTYKGDGFAFRKNTPLERLNQYQLTWFKPSDECLSWVGLTKDIKERDNIFCSYSGPKENLTMAIIGDSTANALMPGFAKIYNDKNEGVINIGYASCPPFRQFGENVYDNKQCAEENRKAYAFILGNPSIKTVVLGFATWLVDDMEAKRKAAGDLSSAKMVATISGMAQQDIAALKKAGKKVVVTFGSPFIGEDPRNCLHQMYHKGNRRCYELGDNILNRQPDLSYWSAFFNKAGVCVFNQSVGVKAGEDFSLLDKDGVLLFRDVKHWSFNGSDKMAHIFFNSGFVK